ncbi:hypothetical protein GCM10009661_57920 [Catellatospora chokoriensis]|uniref:FG-GAP repeat-containing protein n=2 Tax=Catellatospora chokoriensis TaxID=310353 RepID=A0A8J3JZ74_9ACTN|nr:hypothetical protein Cch02nite_72450 [Catellatospora chokoriensis]
MFRLAVGLVVTSCTAVAVPAAAHAGQAAVANPAITAAPAPYFVGTPITVTFIPDGAGTTPKKYRYSVNDGAVREVKASSGQATIALTLTTRTSLLEVNAVGAGGTVSLGSVKYFLAMSAQPAVDKDSNGDGYPDLLISGDPAGLGSGIWLASGDPAGSATGRLRTPAVNVGVHGPFGNDPERFDGAQIVTGAFMGNGFTDVLAYTPNGINPGGGFFMSGTGDGSVMMTHISGNEQHLSAGYMSDFNGNNPLQLTNAYNASGETEPGSLYPDLFGTIGDAVNGFNLAYYRSVGTGSFDFPAQLSNTTPTGGNDWNNWRIASLLLPSGTAMFLWNTTTGALYLWEAVTFADNGDWTGSAAYTQYLISANWQINPDVTLEAADFTRDGVPDLWTVTPTGVATAHVVSGLSATGAAQIEAQVSQALA